MKILFIDDIREPSQYINTNIDSKIFIARNFNEAIKMLEIFTFDIIFFDHDLGEEKTGYDIAKWIIENNIKINKGFNIISSNSVGRFNISQLLNHYRI